MRYVIDLRTISIVNSDGHLKQLRKFLETIVSRLQYMQLDLFGDATFLSCTLDLAQGKMVILGVILRSSALIIQRVLQCQTAEVNQDNHENFKEEELPCTSS